MMTVDRIEDGYAVVENDCGEMERIPLGKLPEGIHEGSVIISSADGYSLDAESERIRRASMAKRTRSLFKKR